MASISTCLSPCALAPQNPKNPPKPSSKHTSRNPNPTRKLKSRSTGYKSPPQQAPSAAGGGGEATTYTRLPPKDDFFTPSIESLLRFSTEVKLSDSTTVVDRSDSVTEIENGADELSTEEEGDDGVELGLNYGKFEVFDRGYDSKGGEGQAVENSDNVFEGFAEGEDEELEDKEKEKGVPAVMRCFDRAKIFVKAGDGGNGVMAFRREKYVPFGGPSGGDGGRGGNVYVEVDGEMNSLLPFRKNIHFRAGRGAHGQGKMQTGAKGEDVVVKVAPGTVIREARNDEVGGVVLLELLHPGQRALLLPGGRGGRGNASFKSGLNKVPKIAENGEEGPEM